MHNQNVKFIRPLAAAALMIVAALAVGATKDPNANYRTWSRFWLPYEADKTALGIFHLDGGQAVDMGKMQKDLSSEKEEDTDNTSGLLLPEDTAVEGKKVADSSLNKWNGTVLDPAENVKDGVFGGGLRLKGGKSALVSPPYADIKNGVPFTAECWVKRETEKECVLFSIDGKLKEAAVVEIRIGADGIVTTYGLGKELGKTTTAVPARKWTHVSAIISGDRMVLDKIEPRPVKAGVEIRINGDVCATIESPGLNHLLANISGVVRVGNRAAGDMGLVGVIDEVRFSNEARLFYTKNDLWADPNASRVLPAGSPYLRDEKDCIFAVPFDGNMAPALAAGDKSVMQELKAKPTTPAVPKPQEKYAPGVRGQAILVGSEQIMPIYQAADNITLDRGTIEFWFSPYDWDNRKEQGFTDPMEYLPLLRVVGLGEDANDAKQVPLISMAILTKRPRDAAPPPFISAGNWFHVVLAWDGGRHEMYLNGQPMPGSVMSLHLAKNLAKCKAQRILIEPSQTNANYLDLKTLVDELRVYSRPLTAEEVANACARYRGDEKLLKPLPFAHVNIRSSTIWKYMGVTAELLSARRDQVAGGKVKITGPDGKVVADANFTAPLDGQMKFERGNEPVPYGKYQVELSFLDASGKPLEQMKIEHDRMRPPWLDMNVGVHEGKVLPGWDPIKVEGSTLGLTLRKITFGGDGLPQAIVARDENILAAPIRIVAKANGAAIDLKPAAAIKVESAKDDAVVTTGSSAGEGLSAATKITTEFDGMMKVETTLTAGAELDSLTIEVPLNARNASILSYWTGHPNFRWSKFYGLTPTKEGVVFTSVKPGVPTNPGLAGSFIPYLFLADDHRGMAWFAENDKGWTKSKDHSAVEVVRDGNTVTLKLNIITEKTKFDGPRTIVFGLQPVPVKATPKNARSWSLEMGFAYVDSFSKQELKGESLNSFSIYPEYKDWDAAAKRMARHQEHYAGSRGYTKPLLYVDRNWVTLPEESSDLRGPWFASGFYRYLPDARDCYLFYMNEWIKRQLVKGIYIDDVWLGMCRDPQTGPGYLLDDGKTVQTGFEWFDYRDFLKRLRWVFIDNGQEPLIWIHATGTIFMPTLSFCDFMLDGEDRFQDWGSPRDFLHCWSLENLRHNNGEKFGMIPLWMNKIGNDKLARVPMPHWFYRQQRSYNAALLLNDITGSGNVIIDAEKAGCYSDESQFVPYWNPACPVKTEPNSAMYASVYLQKDKAAIVVVSLNKDAAEATLEIDAAKLGFGDTPLDKLVIKDCDTYNPPPGEDVTKVAKPKEPDMTKDEPDELDKLIDNTVKDADIKDRKAKGEFFYDDHNFQLKDGKIILRVRAHDYRLLTVGRK